MIVPNEANLKADCTVDDYMVICSGERKINDFNEKGGMPCD